MATLKLPRLSLRLHGGQSAAACVKLAKAAEQAGLEGVWFAENAFARGILPAAAACAVATKTLRIGAGVFNPFSRHPTMMAMEIAALDELTGGRASVTIGSGIASQVAKIGHSAEKPVAALRDSLTILRGLLRGEAVDHEGVFTARKVKLDCPARADLPIYLAGRGDLSVKLAATHADGLTVSNMCSADFSKRAAAILHENWTRGPARPVIIQYIPCAVAEDRAQAIAVAKEAVAAMLPNYWSLAQKIPFAKMGLLLGTNIEESEIAAAVAKLSAGVDPKQALDERFTDAFSIAGTAEDCLAAAAAYAEANVTDLALTMSSAEPGREIALLGAALRKRGGEA
jgi:5,10-methylenetetrahydromethanopterin reductase